MEENKNITIEDLARMIQKGFEETATKRELQDMREEVNGRFEQVDKRFDENDEKFNRLLSFVATQDDIKEIKEDISELRKTVEALTRAVDKLAKVVDDLRVEYAALANKSGRYEKWFEIIANKIGISLPY